MKVIGFSIPVGMEVQAGRVITSKKRGGPVVTNATARKGRKVSATKQKPPRGQSDFTNIAREVARLMHFDGDKRRTSELVQEVTAELRDGVFNPKYWTLCELMATDYLACTPSSVPDPTPPPYNYRSAGIMPTIPTYSAGTPGASGMAYTGSKSGTHFFDNSLSWGRYLFRLNEQHNNTGALNAILIIDGTMNVQASSRGSKPMLSVISSVAVVPAGSPLETTDSPVTDGIAVSAPTKSRSAQSHYYRYKLPSSNPPYYADQQLRPIVRVLDSMASIDGTGAAARAVVLLAPRPMFGRGYNNNNSVQTQLTASVKLWQLNGCTYNNPQGHKEGWGAGSGVRGGYATADQAHAVAYGLCQAARNAQVSSYTSQMDYNSLIPCMAHGKGSVTFGIWWVGEPYQRFGTWWCAFRYYYGLAWGY